jgi:sugar phosphate permease
LVFGVTADVASVRWLYPLIVVAWSAAGFCSGLVTSLEGFYVCRFLLGLFEAAHWPCALRMTQRTFPPHERTWSNGILQSGAALGQILTPLLVVLLARWDASGWRWSCLVVGMCGLPWAWAWWRLVNEADVNRPVLQTNESATVAPDGATAPARDQPLQEMTLVQVFTTRRWWILLVVVLALNMPWHCLRVWMPSSLQAVHGYTKNETDFYTSLFYAASCCGSLLTGWLTIQLALGGWSIHSARLAVFLTGSAMVACLVPVALLGKGPLLLGLLLVVATGALGLNPLYYSLTQELSGRNQGKVGGSLSFCNWVALGFMQDRIGTLVKADPTIHPWVFATVGLLPFVAWLVLLLFWRRAPSPTRPALQAG